MVLSTAGIDAEIPPIVALTEGLMILQDGFSTRLAVQESLYAHLRSLLERFLYRLHLRQLAV